MKVALLSDIHANIHALEEVLRDCERENVKHIIVAGDLVGYYYWPHQVVRRLMHDDSITCIRGNHEEILSKTLRSEDDAIRFRKKYGSGFDICKQAMSTDEKDWLLQLPQSAEVELEKVYFHINHGSPFSLDEYVYPDVSTEVLKRCHVGSGFTVVGHTHYPLIHTIGGSSLVNPGSVGQPRDIGGLASYTVINLSNHIVRFKRIPFDTSKVIAETQIIDPNFPYLSEIMVRGTL